MASRPARARVLRPRAFDRIAVPGSAPYRPRGTAARPDRAQGRHTADAAFVSDQRPGELVLAGQADRLMAQSISNRYRVRRSMVVWWWFGGRGVLPGHALSFWTCWPSRGRVAYTLAYTPVNGAHPPTLWHGYS